MLCDPQVAAARVAVLQAIASAFGRIHEDLGSNAAELQPELHFDLYNQAVWLKCKAKSMVGHFSTKLCFSSCHLQQALADKEENSFHGQNAQLQTML